MEKPQMIVARSKYTTYICRLSLQEDLIGWVCGEESIDVRYGRYSDKYSWLTLVGKKWVGQRGGMEEENRSEHGHARG